MSVCQPELELLSIAQLAWPGLSASPSGEKTVARVGLTTLPAGAELADADELDEPGPLSPSSSLLRPPPTLPKILLTIDASTSSATTMTASAAAPPINRLRRRLTRVPYARPPERGVGGGGESSIGPSTSVRSATAVACCKRFKSVDALRIPPSSCTARTA